MKLSAPLRVTWDWNWPPVVQPAAPARGPGAGRARVIAEELARARILMLEVGYPGLRDLRKGLVRSALGAIGAQKSLVLSPRTLAGLRGETAWEESQADEVWADVTPLAERGQGRIELPTRSDGSAWPDVRVYLTSVNRQGAAEVVRRAVESGCRRISLPILPLFGSFLTSASQLIPSWRNLVEFADYLDPLLERFHDLDLRVHNQALWSLLTSRGFKATEAEAPGHSGCQAASALAYIDPGGILYPCAALPVPLGRMEPGAMARLWSDEERANLRRAIESLPPYCDGCRVWETCRGGCRGWAYFTTGSWTEPGPDCGLPMDESRTTQ